MLLARTIVPVGPEVAWAAPPMSPALAIPDNDATGASSALTVSGSGIGHVETVEVELTIAHTRTSDLEILLQKSGGAQDVLHPLHTCTDPNSGSPTPCTQIDAFVFTSVRHLDEPADGPWTLIVRDRAAGITGTLTSWKLRLYGSN